VKVCKALVQKQLLSTEKSIVKVSVIKVVKGHKAFVQESPKAKVTHQF
jgi:hypothetical protein